MSTQDTTTESYIQRRIIGCRTIMNEMNFNIVKNTEIVLNTFVCHNQNQKLLN